MNLINDLQRVSICSWEKVEGQSCHSIVKKKRLKDERLERDYPEVWSDFNMEVFDKALVNMFDDL